MINRKSIDLQKVQLLDMRHATFILGVQSPPYDNTTATV